MELRLQVALKGFEDDMRRGIKKRIVPDDVNGAIQLF